MYSSGLRGTYNYADIPYGVNAIGYGNSYWLGLTDNGYLIKSSSSNASSWSEVNGYLNDLAGNPGWSGICYGNSRWVANSANGDIAILTTNTIADSGTQASTYTSGNFSMYPSDNIYQSGSNGWYTNVRNNEETITIYSPVNTTMTLTVSEYTPSGSDSGTIYFYTDNKISSYSGSYTVSGSKTFTFSGGSAPSGDNQVVNSSRGSNFGHNLSPYKVKYKCTGCSISEATLTNQYLRDYVGIYGRGRGATSYKQLILSDGTLASRYSASSQDAYTVMMTYESIMRSDHEISRTVDIDEPCEHSYHHDLWNKFRDYPAVQLSNLSKISVNYKREEYHNPDNYYRYYVYGLHAPYMIYSSGGSTSIGFADGDYGYTHNFSGTENGWGNLTISDSEQPYSYNHEGSFSYQDLTREKCVIQTYWKNGRTFSLESTTAYNGLPSDFDNNTAIYLVNLDSDLSTAITAGDYICFFGDGTLSVTVKTNSTPYVRVNSATNNSLTTTINASDWSWTGSKYKATLKLNNAKITKIYQPNKQTTQSYDCSYTESYDCSYTESYDCSYTESYDCSYDEEYDCSYDDEYDCSYDEEYTYDVSVTYPALRAKSNYTVTYSYVDSGTRYVKKETFSNTDTQDGDYKYYIKLPSTATVVKFAARKYSVTETVYDMIDFSANTTANKNGCLSTNFNGTYSNDFYYFGSSSVTKTLTTSRRGRLELKVAPSFYADSGYIKMNYGSDTTAKTITAPTTLSMKYSDLSSGTMQFTMYNCVILYAKLCDVEATIGSPSATNSQTLMWNTQTISTSGTNIDLSGTYSNYNSDWSWHRLTNNSFFIWNNSYVSDITSVLDATSPIWAYWYMPQNVYTDFENTNLVGPMRLFAPITRDSSITPRKYCQMYVGSDSNHINKANLLWHNFTLPGNHVLLRAGYQSVGGDATVAVRSATAAVCAKLKTDYGDNLRVYVVKYRKQTQYKTFPAYNVTQSNANHDYSVIDKCATDTGGLTYDVSTEADLKTTLNTIANNIKSFAGGVTAARNVN